MTELLDNIQWLMGPENDGYGIVWALICPETSAGAIYGTTNYRTFENVLRLTREQRLEETAFIAEALFKTRRSRFPAFRLSSQDFERSEQADKAQPYSSYKFQLLPKTWFVRQSTRRRDVTA